MADTLLVSSAELKAKAEKIQESAQKIENVIKEKMMGHLDDMAEKGNKIWCGPASVKFEKRYRAKCEKVLAAVDSISEQADNVITAANNYAKNEQQNEEIATSLSNDLTGIF